MFLERQAIPTSCQPKDLKERIMKAIPSTCQPLDYQSLSADVRSPLLKELSKKFPQGFSKELFIELS